MSFCAFSKDFDENAYTVVENRFITKYLPGADGFAVKVYLYGLYLCRNETEFSVSAMAEVFGCTAEKIQNAFYFWEDYDLISVLSKEPFIVQYLPVRSALGRPKKPRYEQYADFNKTLQQKMQSVGKFLTANDFLKYMHFLQDTEMQPAALLLIVDYCIAKQGERLSPSYVFNKANKYVRNGWITKEQVERELASINVYETDVEQLFKVMHITKKPEETDFTLYRTWVETLGMSKGAVLAAAKSLKKPTVSALDLLLGDLSKLGKTDKTDAEEYLAERDMLVNLTFRIGNKLGAIVHNPAAYVDEFTKKWFDCGYEENALLQIARYCLRTDRNKFSDMDEEVTHFFNLGVISEESVKAYLKVKNDQLELLMKIQAVCGQIRKNSANLSFIETWQNWNFSEPMILEAAKRACSSASPIPYMNKILSDWKRESVYTVSDIPSPAPVKSTQKADFIQADIQAKNAKTDKDRYYSELRERAQTIADRNLAIANKNARFKEVALALSKMEISLAKAEVFEPKTLPALKEEKSLLLAERKELLKEIGLTERDLLPQYTCKKCMDTGFTKAGTACDCYKK